MTLRRRLALWYGGLLGVVLAAALAVAYVQHVESHDADLDAALVDMVETAYGQTQAQLADGIGIESVRLPGIHGALDEPHAVWIVLDGRPISWAGRVEDASFLSLFADGVPDGFRTTTSYDGRVRTLAMDVPGTAARIIGAAALAPMDASTSQLRLVLLYLLVGSVALAVIGGSSIAAHALRPLAALTETAATIARSRDLGRRVPVRPHPKGRHDELETLRETFNEMLESVEAAYRAQQRFVSDVSHELRTPLTVIRGNAELLEASCDDEAQHVAIEQIAREARRLSRLVHDLLTLARADGVPPPLQGAPCQLDEIVMGAFEELRSLPGPHMRVRRLDPVTVAGERDRLYEVAVVLLDNARRYTPATGSVTVSVVAAPASAAIVIEDDGIGIAPKDLAHVFERFWRAEDARRADPSGSGLGLPIAKWIVERHGGTIDITPRPGGGTRVSVELPRPDAVGGRTTALAPDAPESQTFDPSRPRSPVAG